MLTGAGASLPGLPADGWVALVGLLVAFGVLLFAVPAPPWASWLGATSAVPGC
jgi:hypothetical protein